MTGTLFVVATPIGNLEDVTARALRVLREVAIIAAEDTRRTAHLLARFAITTPTTSLHEHNETRKSSALIARLERGDNIALVSDAGTPAISDPGTQLIAAAVAAGIRIEPVPGANAAIAALAVSAFPTESFCFLGFPPTRSKDRTKWFGRVVEVGGTVVFYEAPHRIHDTLLELQGSVGDCEVLVCRELTKAHETLVRGPISRVLPELEAPRGEFTVVLNIGHTTVNTGTGDIEPESIAVELGQIASLPGVSKRQAINVLSRRHNMRPNEIYALLEKAKKHGN